MIATSPGFSPLESTLPSGHLLKREVSPLVERAQSPAQNLTPAFVVAPGAPLTKIPQSVVCNTVAFSTVTVSNIHTPAAKKLQKRQKRARTSTVYLTVTHVRILSRIHSIKRRRVTLTLSQGREQIQVSSSQDDNCNTARCSRSHYNTFDDNDYNPDGFSEFHIRRSYGVRGMWCEQPCQSDRQLSHQRIRFGYGKCNGRHQQSCVLFVSRYKLSVRLLRSGPTDRRFYSILLHWQRLCESKHLYGFRVRRLSDSCRSSTSLRRDL